MAKKTAAAVSLQTMKSGFSSAGAARLFLQDARINNTTSSASDIVVTFYYPTVGVNETPLTVITSTCSDGYLVIDVSPSNPGTAPQDGHIVVSLTLKNPPGPPATIQGTLETAFYPE
ncbi:MAG: hypothetical protein FJ309_13300 [Planctomycetes bacterium]|nr:hypothetical protein [Planctomycetota bacterium]